MLIWKCSIYGLTLVAGSVFAQSAFIPGDVEDGRRLFRANCAICHGPEGDAVPGIDFGHGKFIRTSSDDDLRNIIINGIDGTAMPPHNFTSFQAGTVVAYLRFMSASASDAIGAGDPVRGRTIFEGKGGCLNCHRVAGAGSRLGPELTDIGSQRRAVELKKSILDPNAEILPQNRFMRVLTKAGASVTGRLLNQDAFTIQLLDSTERLVSFPKSNLREYGFLDKSPMPSYQGKLHPEEVVDVVSYLVSLKGIDRP